MCDLARKHLDRVALILHCLSNCDGRSDCFAAAIKHLSDDELIRLGAEMRKRIGMCPPTGTHRGESNSTIRTCTP